MTMDAADSPVREFDRWDDDLVRLEAVDLLDDLQRELVRPGQTGQLDLHINETLAVIRVLGTVVRRVHQLDHAR
ncbi:hypothetical protein EV646_111222 [Kribbella antiqua]|uniref:Uncharacterized protein n=1 Tax=Kribbella antiqua TaxID=2512217 RepID=A0A4V2S3E5_9ACTN|nr:hypothetical protein [Kribbella antiqua]TCO44030.1 hypothetical protein EV646_111222 [Kribbella antiqua]